jgi:DNA polymerase-3 subunit beta
MLIKQNVNQYNTVQNMKFNVSSTKLFAQLQAVSRVIAAKNSLQILETVLFELKDNTLTLTASD